MKSVIYTKMTALLLIFAMLFSQFSFIAFTADDYPEFPDIKGHYAESAINEWAKQKFVSGFPDGTFRPQENLTRAQFVVLLNRAFKHDSSDEVSKTFSDVKTGTWYYDDVMLAAKLGIIAGYPDGRFGSDDPIIRQDVCVIISKYFSLSDNSDSSYIDKFTDKAEISDYAVNHIAAVTKLEIVNGRPDGTFAPKEFITRADSIIMLNNAYNLFVNDVETPINDDDTPLGSPVTPTPSPISTSNSSGGGGRSGGNGGNNNNQTPILTINTSAFTPLDDIGISFYAEDKIDALTGTITDVANVLSMSINVTSGNLKVFSGSITPSANWSYGNPILTVAKNKISINAVMKNGTSIERSIVLINDSEENFDDSSLDKADSDRDGLLNWLEDLYGTDKNKPDTDDDGLTDYQEIFVTFTNPLVYDTNSDGISDGNEDFDKDGLNNIQECAHGTNPFNVDTDNDSLSDYDEIFVYFSNPLLVDSDSDELPDILEIKYRMNPKNPDTLGDGILDGDRIFTVVLNSNDTSDNDMVKPSLKIDVQGKQIESLSIDKVNDDDIFLNTDIPGYVGNAFDFNVEGTFSSATLEFELDKALFNDPDFVPAIYYWDEEAQFLFELPNQQISDKNLSAEFDQQIDNTHLEIDPAVLIDLDLMPEIYYEDETERLEELPEQEIDANEIPSELDQSLPIEPDVPLEPNNSDEDDEYLPEFSEQADSAIDDNVISAEVQHFSKYIVLAKNIHDEELFRYEILPPTDEELQNKKFDLALVLDESSSISAADYTLMKNLARDLVGKLDDEDRIAVFTFDNSVRRRSGFVNKSSAASIITGLSQNRGSTAIYNAINSANNEFIANSSSDASKIMVMLTDGQDNASTVSASAVIQTALNNKIAIYTVGIGSVNASVLNSIATSTGGKYYSATNFSQLAEIFDKIKVDVDLYKDSDGDGISDYHEKKIAAGQLKLGTGAPMANFVSLDYLNPDSDGDGVNDGVKDSFALFDTNQGKVEGELYIKDQKVQGQSVYYINLKSNPCMTDTDGDHITDDLDPEPLKHFYSYIPTFFERDAALYKYWRFDYRKDYCKNINSEVNDSFDYIEKLSKLQYFKTSEGIKILDDIKKEIHYFRNNLNYEPESLVKLLQERNSEGWVSMLASGTVYHMEGENGGYNIKWLTPSGVGGLSGDRLFEAVYGLGGRLLNKTTDPKNMGTYNYGYSNSNHSGLDVEPYLKYGNVPGVPVTYQSDLEAWTANYFKSQATIPINYRLAIEDRDYSWTKDKNGVISKPTGAIPFRSFYYVLLGDDDNNYFRLTSEFLEVTDFVMGGKGDDIYEMQADSNSIIYDTDGKNTLGFDFKVSGIISSVPLYDGNKGTEKYLLIKSKGKDIEISVVEYVLGVWWNTNLICTLLDGTKYDSLLSWNGSTWSNIN